MQYPLPFGYFKSFCVTRRVCSIQQSWIWLRQTQNDFSNKRVPGWHSQASLIVSEAIYWLIRTHRHCSRIKVTIQGFLTVYTKPICIIWVWGNWFWTPIVQKFFRYFWYIKPNCFTFSCLWFWRFFLRNSHNKFLKLGFATLAKSKKYCVTRRVCSIQQSWIWLRQKQNGFTNGKRFALYIMIGW